jgi:hypothetical protein
MRRRRPATRVEALRWKPIRSSSLEWTDEGGRVLLRVPVEMSGRWRRLLARALKAPSYREVELDDLGAFVWRLCDGARTTKAIAAALKEEYRLTQPEAEASLLSFLASLSQRGYISFREK